MEPFVQNTSVHPLKINFTFPKADVLISQRDPCIEFSIYLLISLLGTSECCKYFQNVNKIPWKMGILYIYGSAKHNVEFFMLKLFQ